MMTLRPFDRADFDWYAGWFRDPWLDAALGPLDAAWRDHVLADPAGAQFVACEGAVPVAVAGVVWGTPAHPYHVVSDLAVCPARRRTGLGGRVLRALLARPPATPYPDWVAFVDRDNPGAGAFFRKQGWRPDAALTDPHMVAFRAPGGR